MKQTIFKEVQKYECKRLDTITGNNLVQKLYYSEIKHQDIVFAIV